MKTLYLIDNETFEFEEGEIERKENSATIKVMSMGICGSDISAYLGKLPLGKLPRVLGHEIAGIITEISENDKGLKVGDKVSVEPYQYCGKCYPCSKGRTNSCENMKVIGVHENGGFREYISHPIHLLHKLPEDMSWEHAAMVEPLTISMHGVDRGNVKDREHVVVTGAGTIGILAALYAKYLGAKTIIVDPLQKRLNVAKGLGIDYVINPEECDDVKKIVSITNGRMAEFVVEASGAPIAIENTIKYVSNTGRVSLVGYPKKEVSLPTFLITRKEIDFLGARNCVELFPKAVELIYNKKILVDDIITNVISFEEMPTYFKSIADVPTDYLKVIAKMK